MADDVVTVIDTKTIAPDGTPTIFDFVDFESDWTDIDTDYVSLVIRLRDSNTLSGLPELRVFWINVTDFSTGEQRVFYNFSNAVRVNEAQGAGCTPKCMRGFVDSDPTTLNGILRTGTTWREIF